jgi:hypothetical protein
MPIDTMPVQPVSAFEPVVAQVAVAFEPFHGYPAGLRIHVKDTARLDSLGRDVLGAGRDADVLEIDAVTALQADLR